ncbi:MAG: sec-independent protein translocase protein TatC [Planctomycetota bacterium]
MFRVGPRCVSDRMAENDPQPGPCWPCTNSMSPETNPLEETRMSLAEHLNELRRRLFRGVLAVAVAFGAGLFFQAAIVEFVKQPYMRASEMLNEYWLETAIEAVAEDPTCAPEFFQDGYPEVVNLLRPVPDLIGLKPSEGFLFSIKVVFYAALVTGGPVLLWQMWQFIASGLYKHERKLVYAYFPISLGMLAAGISFGFFATVPYAIYFLNKDAYALMSITTEYYLTFVTGLCIAFGVVFQLPLVLTFLGRAGMVEAKTLRSYRGHFLLGAFVFAAILTPPDPFTQALLGLPMILLYELGIIGCRIWGRPRSRSVVVADDLA